MRLHIGQYNSVQNRLLIAQATIGAFTQVHRTTEMKYECIIPCTTKISLTPSLSILNAGLHVLQEHHGTINLQMILWKRLLLKKLFMPLMVASVGTLIQVLSQAECVCMTDKGE